MGQNQSVIVSALRSPQGCFQGDLSSFTAIQLGSLVLEESLKRLPLEANQIDEVIMGCVLSAGLSQAPARQVAIGAGIPNSVGALTVNKVCGSSLKAVIMADQMIRCGDAFILATGGIESMTNTPYYLAKARQGFRLGHGEILDGMIFDGLWDPYNNYHMGNAGERFARNMQISRERQDAFAMRSYQRALKATEEGSFEKEIVPLEIVSKKGVRKITEDEEIRKGMAKIDKIDKLKPAFDKEGTITPANASKISDGAAVVIVMHAEKAKELGITPLVRIVGHAQVAMAPEDFPQAPVSAINSLCKKTGIALEDVDRFEINEAFSVVTEGCIEKLQLNPDRVNCRGGAVAIGHPIGASGARILTTLVHQMNDEKLKRGIAAICIGGGEAIALMVERV